MATKKEDKKITVSANYEFGQGHEIKDDEGYSLCLWGVVFTCDGKAYKAELLEQDAKEMIDSGRVSKV
jgi:hypothetical protein